ncbi:UbiA family prenyltransferase [Pontibacter beigongshangensis]|uniref:UbiA family prenyltransferase n=1 Tax=Pontibacter beigongshangensis TaxID=2574733 RepID=UPI00164FFB82|nr:UbiA family prenyltransferase [Pontibacter beigongshangensis]
MASNLWAYFKERFPVINMALFAILFLTVHAVATYFSAAAEPPVFGWKEVLGMVATISFFFRLRVFDEIKDYDLDAINHPQRVLQSGRVTIRQLVVLALAGVALELIWAWLMGVPTFVCWALAIGYSLLMRYEFFVSDYLKKRLVLYAITHMLIMPLVILWIWSAYVPDYGLSTTFFMLAMLSLLGGFSFEIARKIHAQEAERELVDSYSKSMGFGLAIITVLVILLLGVAVQSYLLWLLQARLWPFVLLGLLYLLTLGLYLFSLRRPQEKTLKLAEVFVSLFMLVSYLSIIVEVHF